MPRRCGLVIAVAPASTIAGSPVATKQAKPVRCMGRPRSGLAAAGALLSVLSSMFGLFFTGCGDRVLKYEESKDLLTVIFVESTSTHQVDSIFVSNHLQVVLKHHWPWAPLAFRVSIDRTLVPRTVTAALLAPKLVRENPGIVEEAVPLRGVVHSLEAQE